MHNRLLQHIINDFKNQHTTVLRVENNDGYLFRVDVNKLFKEHNIQIISGSSINQRVAFELRDPKNILILLSDDNSNYLDDIKQTAIEFEFFLKNYISGYHIPTIIKEPISTLETLYNKKQIVALSKSQTIDILTEVKTLEKEKADKQLNLRKFSEDLDNELNTTDIDWLSISKIISNGLLTTIGTKQLEQVMLKINEVNDVFQNKIEKDFQSSKNSSPVKKPQIVSKILDYIDFNFKNDKVALIVVDGLSHWQYQILSSKLPGVIKEDMIYSWIPSITQLSRQAIFKGGNPTIEYRQGPINETKLWKNYWKSKGFNDFEIRYNHQKINLKNLESIKRFALIKIWMIKCTVQMTIKIF